MSPIQRSPSSFHPRSAFGVAIDVDANEASMLVGSFGAVLPRAVACDQRKFAARSRGLEIMLRDQSLRIKIETRV